MGRNKKELEDKKKKITLTIDTTVYDLLKKHLNNKGEWNESAYIESLLQKDLNKPINDDLTFTHRFLEDVKRIQNIILNKTGHLYSLKECDEFWSEYSDDLAAGWLMLDTEDEQVWKILYKYINK